MKIAAIVLVGVLVTLSGRTAAQAGPNVAVETADARDLYFKLLHPAYAGTTLKLSGSYALSAADGSDAVDRVLADPGVDPAQLDAKVVDAMRLGYIDLGDRHLRGENEMRLEDGIAHDVEVDTVHGRTVIDGNALQPNTIFAAHYSVVGLLFPENRSLVRAAHGNRIEGITLRWRQFGASFQQAISVEGVGISVSRCEFDIPNLQCGILVYARGKDLEGGEVSAWIVENRGDPSVIGPGFVICSTLFTRDAITTVHLSGNDFRAHVAFHNPASEGGQVHVVSKRNRFVGRGAAPGAITPALHVRGGFAPAAFAASLSNQIVVESTDDRFEGALGVRIRGGAGTTRRADDNEASVTLLRPHFAGSTTAIDAAGRETLGDDNRALVEVRDATANSTTRFVAAHETGTTPGLNNTLEVLGSRRAWERTNDILPPGYEFFTVQEWSPPENLGSVVNSPFNEDLPHISRDGLRLFFISNRPGGFGDFDIFVSKRKKRDDPWGPPMNLGPVINTPFNERGPCLSRDGHFLFFSSTRPGGFGSQDLWMSYRQHTHDDSGWQAPVNLGPGINTVDPDFGAGLLENDDTGVPQLYFGRREGGLDADIFMSDLQPDGSWGPGALVTELSTDFDDLRPTLRPDGLELFFNSTRPDSQLNDIWVSTRETTLEPWSTPVNLGPAINTASQEQFPAVSSDGGTLIFSSTRPGGQGSSDLWVSEREKHD